jgi:RsiW-degrading membrane proteinase PrsW (M82 family)
MWLKVVIVLLFIGVLISLSSALVFLMKDLGSPKKRILYALAVRIILAAALIATIIYGFYTGQLSSKAPWDRQLHPETIQLPNAPN